MSDTSITFSWPAPENVNFLMNYRVSYTSTPISTSKRRRRQSPSSDSLTVPANMRSTDLVFQPYSMYMVDVDAIYNPPNRDEVTVCLLPTTRITTPQGSKRLQIHSHNACSTFRFTCTIHAHVCSCKCTCDSNYLVHVCVHTHALIQIHYSYIHALRTRSLTPLAVPITASGPPSFSQQPTRQEGFFRIVLSWTPPANPNGVITDYKVRHAHAHTRVLLLHLYMYILHFLSRCL